MEKTFYKSRLRTKGQITLPSEIRNLLSVAEGDDLLFSTDEKGHVVISRAQIVPPDQAWFWSERWQKMEQLAQAELDAGNVVEFPDVAAALTALDQIGPGDDAED